ncbi:MAG: hypothetical protein ACI9U0_001774 [Flavobacteriales bacterium]|jgi:hypothetical protein|tara:strand:- start:124 stop:321 length:198 start_codon:yes stop_codon:yes gene_type:complete
MKIETLNKIDRFFLILLISLSIIEAGLQVFEIIVPKNIMLFGLTIMSICLIGSITVRIMIKYSKE